MNEIRFTLKHIIKKELEKRSQDFPKRNKVIFKGKVIRTNTFSTAAVKELHTFQILKASDNLQFYSQSNRQSNMKEAQRLFQILKKESHPMNFLGSYQRMSLHKNKRAKEKEE